jgi:hypothetical protein
MIVNLLQIFDQLSVEQNLVTPLALAVEVAQLEVLGELLVDVLLLVVSLYHSFCFLS